MTDKNAGGTFDAVVVIDPKDIGGEIRLLVDGCRFVVTGRLARGLREMATREKGVPDLYAEGY